MKVAGLVNEPKYLEPADGFRSSPDATRRCVCGSRIAAPGWRGPAPPPAAARQKGHRNSDCRPLQLECIHVRLDPFTCTMLCTHFGRSRELGPRNTSGS